MATLDGNRITFDHLGPNTKIVEGTSFADGFFKAALNQPEGTMRFFVYSTELGGTNLGVSIHASGTTFYSNALVELTVHS